MTDANKLAMQNERRTTALIRDRDGFTLIEVLVVLVILGILAAVVTIEVTGRLSESKYKAARIEIENVRSALDLYRLDMGSYPTTEEGLAALSLHPADDSTSQWKGPYLRHQVIADPWGHAYSYTCPSDSADHPFELVSYGADGKAGGEKLDKDLSIWDDSK